MDIANLILRLFMHIAAIMFNPLTITGESLVRKRFDGDNARLFGVRILNGKLHLIISLVNQQFLRAALSSNALPIDGQNSIALGNVQTWAGERRGGFAVRGVAIDDARNGIARIFGVVAPIDAQKALTIVGA